ncbi:MAG TPA: ABC transporter ATP-binding protein, partial [Candidatus Saccharimonadales bacterium]|nr:ABC transporter ATP-binding protein [Candidatus Saccharimonadales bacterium]
MMRTKRDPSVDRQTIAIFWRVILGNKPLFLRSLVYMIGVVCISVLVPLFISLTLAGLATRSGDVVSYIFPLAIAAGVGVLANLYGFSNILKLQAKCQADTLELAMRTLLGRSVGFHTNTIGGKLVSNALDFPNAFSQLVGAAYINMTPFILIMVVGICVVLSRSLPMGLALVGVVAITLTLTLIESRRRLHLRLERKKAQNEMIAHASDTLVNAQAVKTFAQEKGELKMHNIHAGKLLDLRLRDWNQTARSGSARMAVLLALQISFIAFVGYLLHQDPSVLAIGIFSFSYMLTLTSRLFEIDSMIRNVEEALLSAASMTEILSQKTEIVDAPHAKSLTVTDGQLELKNVDFGYHDDSSNEKVFTRLSLHIPAGQKVGLVGPSGGGKSTLTRLLLRFDDIDEGSITIDGQDVREVTQASL